VSDDKRKAVEDVIERLGFTRNMMARGLKLGRTHTLGVVMPEVTSSFWEMSLRGIEDRLRGSGYIPMLMSGHWDAEQEAQRVELLVQRQVDGIILLSGRLGVERIKRFASQRPIAVFGRVLEADNAIGVCLDNRGGALEAATHLIDLGHRQIVFIAGIPEHRDAIDRMTGYRDALEAAGIPFDRKLVVQGDFTETGGFLAMNRMIDSGQAFTAVFAANDQTAFGARLAFIAAAFACPTTSRWSASTTCRWRATPHRRSPPCINRSTSWARCWWTRSSTSSRGALAPRGPANAARDSRIHPPPRVIHRNLLKPYSLSRFRLISFSVSIMIR
jgi:LacI family transcriptional regulator